MKSKLIVGSLEVCDLPDLGLYDLEVRVDTGAKTSSLHAENIVKFQRNGKPWLRFNIHPNANDVGEIKSCEAALHGSRRVKSSNSASEKRYVIKTLLKMGGKSWPIEITLTNRSDMNYLMLLGREGMGERILVDPSQVFVLT